MKDCIITITSELNILNLGIQAGDWNSDVRFMHVPCFHRYILFPDQAQFTCDGVHNTKNTCGFIIIHMEQQRSNFQYSFSVNVWCGVADDQLTGPFPQRLTGYIYAEFLQNELPALRERSSAKTITSMTGNVMQYVNKQFSDRYIGYCGPQNWPPRSPDLRPPDFHVGSYMKNRVYERKVHTRDELLQRIFDAIRCVNNTAVLREITLPIVKRVRMCIQAHGGQFEQ